MEQPEFIFTGVIFQEEDGYTAMKKHQIVNIEIKGDKNETPKSDCDVSVGSIVVERGDAGTGRVERDGAAAAA